MKKTRVLTGLLRDELYSVSDLYDELGSRSVDFLKFNYANDEEIVFKAGEVQADCDRTLRNAEVKRLRNEHEQKMAEVEIVFSPSFGISTLFGLFSRPLHSPLCLSNSSFLEYPCRQRSQKCLLLLFLV